MKTLLLFSLLFFGSVQGTNDNSGTGEEEIKIVEGMN
jgi:hypothetical protein